MTPRERAQKIVTTAWTRLCAGMPFRDFVEPALVQDIIEAEIEATEVHENVCGGMKHLEITACSSNLCEHFRCDCIVSRAKKALSKLNEEEK